MPKTLPTAKYLRECFIYNRTTGELRWKERPREHFSSLMIYATRNSRFTGKLAGTVHPSGYIRVGVGGKGIFRVHRVIWKIMTGKEPPYILDHRDGDTLNNRWSNLRPATQHEHARNRKLQKNNTTGTTGVHRRDNKWRIKIGGRFIGTFDTLEAAIAARTKLAKKQYGAFYRA